MGEGHDHGAHGHDHGAQGHDHPVTKSSPWGKILGIGCLLVILLGGLCAVSMYFAYGKALVAGVQQTKIRALSQLEDKSQEAAFNDKFDQLIRVGEGGTLSSAGLLAVVLCIEHASPANTPANKISSSEGAKILELFDELLAKKGNIAMPEFQAFEARVRSEVK